jgi:hypothetical protein
MLVQPENTTQHDLNHKDHRYKNGLLRDGLKVLIKYFPHKSKLSSFVEYKFKKNVNKLLL